MAQWGPGLGVGVPERAFQWWVWSWVETKVGDVGENRWLETAGYWIGTGKGLVGRLGVGRLTGGNTTGAGGGRVGSWVAANGHGKTDWRINWGARGFGGGAWIGGARIDGDLQGIRTGWGRVLARGCGVGGQQGGHGFRAAVWAAGGLRDVIHGCNVWLPKLWWCWLRSWLGMLSLEFLILVRFKI